MFKSRLCRLLLGLLAIGVLLAVLYSAYGLIGLKNIAFRLSGEEVWLSLENQVSECN